MLFGNEAATRVEGLWSEVVRAGDNRANLWHEGWDAPLDILVACYGAATATHSPEAWRSVVVQGRALRLALESCDGFEHRIFIAVTRLTDAVDEEMDVLAKAGRGLVMPEQVERLIKKVEYLEQAVREDRAQRKGFEIEAKRTLDQVAEKISKAKKALVHLENVTLKPNFSLLSTGLAEVADLIATIIKFIESRKFVQIIKDAAYKVKQASVEFFQEVRRSFAAFKLPWSKMEDKSPQREPESEVVKLRRDLDALTRSSHNISGYIYLSDTDNPRFDVVDINHKYDISESGDTLAEHLYTIETLNEPAHFWRFWISADPESLPMQSLGDLRLEATDLSTRAKLDWLPTSNTEHHKVFAIFFPEMQPGSRKRILVSYTWPGYLRKLLQNGAANWEWSYKSATPNQRAPMRLEWRFPSAIGNINCRLIRKHSETASLRNDRGAQWTSWVYHDPEALMNSAKRTVEFCR